MHVFRRQRRMELVVCGSLSPRGVQKQAVKQFLPPTHTVPSCSGFAPQVASGHSAEEEQQMAWIPGVGFEHTLGHGLLTACS